MISILTIVSSFIGILITLYVLLATFFFSRNYKIKSDKIFPDAVKTILENTESTKTNNEDNNEEKAKIKEVQKVSIKSYVEKNPDFGYLKSNSRDDQ